VPRAEIKYDDYKVKAFLDANIILKAVQSRSCRGRTSTGKGQSSRSSRRLL
jgi:hypothetical protein